MSDKKNKKELGYQADIQYEEDYSSDYSGSQLDGLQQQTVTIPSDSFDDLYNEDFMDNIQEHINALVQMIPGLPVIVQTAINQVFKPLLKDWNEIKDEKYPIRIPDPNKGIIIDPEEDPWQLPDPKPPIDTTFPLPPEVEERPQTIIPVIDSIPMPGTTPDPTPIITPGTTNSIVTDDGLFDPGSDRKVVYETIEETEKIKMEYIKNFADVIDYYTSKLNDIISGFYLFLFSAFTSATSTEDTDFFTKATPLTLASSIREDLRHVMDVALRNEVVAVNKINFCINTFPLESSLFHLKSFKMINELRLRYAGINKQENDSHASSMSNKLLNGMTDMYNAKYDVAYNNLYKYLNSSLYVLEDAMNTLSSSIKAKETIVRKDGFVK